MSKRLGTSFYNIGLYTKGGILLHPGKLVRALWGVLPVRPMGATVRMTRDRRILIRNTAEVYNPYYMSQSEL